jgi:hypothetical protein
MFCFSKHQQTQLEICRVRHLLREFCLPIAYSAICRQNDYAFLPSAARLKGGSENTASNLRWSEQTNYNCPQIPKQHHDESNKQTPG